MHFHDLLKDLNTSQYSIISKEKSKVFLYVIFFYHSSILANFKLISFTDYGYLLNSFLVIFNLENYVG